MSTDQSPPDPDGATPHPGTADRPPRWLIASQVGVAVAVVAVIIGSVAVLRRSNPQVIVLRHPDVAEATPGAAGNPPPSPISLSVSDQNGPVGAIDHRAPQRGQPAPDFALLDLDGTRVRLSDLRGKVVVVNFWATWCGPCKQEFPELQKAAATAGGDVVVLALDQSENADRVSQFRDQYGASFTILMDSRNEVANSYLLSGIPDTIIIDRTGMVSDVAIGPLSAGTFRYKINQALTAR